MLQALACTVHRALESEQHLFDGVYEDAAALTRIIALHFPWGSQGVPPEWTRLAELLRTCADTHEDPSQFTDPALDGQEALAEARALLSTMAGPLVLTLTAS